MIKFSALVALAMVLVLGGCATIPTYNPDGAAEEELVEMAMAEVKPDDYASAFAIVRINGEPVEVYLDAEKIESNERADATALRLPAGSYNLAIRLANGHLLNRSLYLDQEIDLTVDLSEPGARYLLSRENGVFDLGSTTIVLRHPGPIPIVPTLFARTLQEFELHLVGRNEYELVQ